MGTVKEIWPGASSQGSPGRPGLLSTMEEVLDAEETEADSLKNLIRLICDKIKVVDNRPYFVATDCAIALHTDEVKLLMEFLPPGILIKE